MHDHREEGTDETTYECLGCGELVTAASHPGDCSGCGGTFQNRTTPRE